MSDLIPIKTLLVNQCGVVLKSITDLASVYVNPSAWSVVEGLDKPLGIVWDLDESPTYINMARKSKLLVQFDIYLKSSDGSYDNSKKFYTSQQSIDLDSIHAKLNAAMLDIRNPMHTYCQLIEEIAVSKNMGYDDFSVLVNQYQITYITQRGNPYQAYINNK